ncbi:MAG: VacJ family lipoprotein [Pseudomonadota bacterium]
MFLTKITTPIILLACVLCLSACSSNSSSTGELEIYDPAEEVNRVTLKINDAADKAILEPVARGYRLFTPGALRTAIRNFLRNLQSPIIIGNQLLQGDLEGAGNATARVVINTLAGFGGILDLAADGGIPHEPEDFGQTLAKWGFGNGPYVVLPLLGPSTFRDATGIVVDSYADPLRMYLFNIHEEPLHYVRVGAGVISQREELLDIIDDLRRNSFDYYAAVRSAYYQNRQALINDKDPSAAAVADIPEYDDF